MSHDMTPFAFYKKSAVYGRRLGRPLSSSKRQTLEGGTQAFAFVLPESDTPGTLSPSSLFPDASKNLVLEIGFGYGEHLLMKAQTHPDWNFIGVEPYVNGLSNLFKESTELNLKNIRTYQGNGHHLLHHLSPQCLDEIYLLFPDPWPKKRHNKRRFIQKDTLNLSQSSQTNRISAYRNGSCRLCRVD